MVRVFAVILVCAGLAWAADPVARVTSAGPIELSGNPVPTPAAASLPLVAGDEITTSSSAALLVFRDRSRLMVAPNSRVKLEGDGASIMLRISRGGAELYASKGSSIGLINQAASSPSLMPGLRHLALTLRPADDEERSRKCPPGHGDPDGHDCRIIK